MNQVPLVSIRHLSKRYGKFLAINDLNLDLQAGHIVALMGDNGSGKTTLFKIMAGVMADHSGEVRIGGQELGVETKAMTSFLPDTSFLPKHLRIRQTLNMYQDFFADFSIEKAEQMLAHFKLDTDRKMNELSKGMFEKLQIALTMSRKARLYLLDEPISGVDPAARETILDGIVAAFDPESLLIVSTHLITDIEPVADYAIFLRQGQILMQGDADDLRTNYQLSLDAIFRKEFA